MSDITTPGTDGTEPAVTSPAEATEIPAARASAEWLTGPAVPETANWTLTDSDIPVPRVPWYRKVPRIAWASIAAVIAGAVTALVLMLTVFSGSTPASPDSILAKDGYTGTVSISGSALSNILGSSGPDAAPMKNFVTSASAGFKSGKEEVVFTLTPVGQQVFTGLVPTFRPGDAGPGVTVHMDGGNRYLVVDGPISTLGNPATT